MDVADITAGATANLPALPYLRTADDPKAPTSSHISMLNERRIMAGSGKVRSKLQRDCSERITTRDFRNTDFQGLAVFGDASRIAFLRSTQCAKYPYLRRMQLMYARMTFAISPSYTSMESSWDSMTSAVPV